MDLWNKNRIDNEDDDEFFGSQEEERTEDVTNDNVKYKSNSNMNTEFGSMAEKELLARENQLRNITYIDAYDEYKESRLQEGFEYGIKETFDIAVRMGKLLGKVTTKDKLLEKSSKTSASEDQHDNSNTLNEANTVTMKVQDYFCNQFQQGNCDDCKQEMEALVKDLESVIGSGDL